MTGMVDVHCHLLPGIDDGAPDLEAALAMAAMQVDQGVDTVVVTPHQLGAFAHNSGEDIRARTAALQEELDRRQIPLRLLPGADVRIDDGMVEGLVSGEVVSLADRRRHVLLELPHELYFPLEPVLDALAARGMVGVLSHPERNAGLLARHEVVESLVERGCLMQVTAGSLSGTFGPSSRSMAEWMASRGLLHFLATDSHSPQRRRPRLREAFEAASLLAGEEAAARWCRTNPRAVADGGEVAPGATPVRRSRRGWSLFRRGAA